MQLFGINLDFNTLSQIIFTFLILAFGLLHLIKNTASKYFESNANFNTTTTRRKAMQLDQPCSLCGNPGSKQCSRCKSVRYCSQECQSKDWSSGHKNKCKKLALCCKSNSTPLAGGSKASFSRSDSAGVSLVTSNEGSKVVQIKKILCPYDEFIKFFNWDLPGLPPCGLINCGNSCFANVVLQCLSFTRPLVAYLLEKGHRRQCTHNDWCFLCEFQVHVERAHQSLHPFSPINILSHLPNIGGNLGIGSQEDAHEFMRFAIDTVQSVCLNEFGGERAVHPCSQKTTLIQHIFGGQLHSQVICTQCEKDSNQYENMMDLTVEIHGDASSLEECLNQYTAEEWLHGENMYKCDGCNDYVKAWKRLRIQTPPNILTIALKRFQSGRFGKLNKKVTFPETLDLSPYMSEAGDGKDVYKLYAVVVHLDMLNACYFGHYICYTKDFCGKWYKIDDCKVKPVSLEEVLSQGAYMLLYSRVSVRPSCLKATEHLEEVGDEKGKAKVEPCLRKHNNSFALDPTCNSVPLTSDRIPYAKHNCGNKELIVADKFESIREHHYADVITSSSSSSKSQDSSGHQNGSSSVNSYQVPADMSEDSPMSRSPSSKEKSRQEGESSDLKDVGDAKRAGQMAVVDPTSFAALSVYHCREEEPQAAGESIKDADLVMPKLSVDPVKGHNNVEAVKRAGQMSLVDPASLASLSVACCSEEEPGAAGENSKDADLVLSKSSIVAVENLKVNSNGHARMEHDGFPDKVAPSSFLFFR